MNPIKFIKRKANLLYTLLAAVFAYTIPMFGIFMDDYGWWKWIYILGSHIIGLGIFLFVHRWYLINLNGC